MGKAEPLSRSSYDQRTLLQVLKKDWTNIALFHLPMIAVHILALWIKPYLTDSTKGPWEILWHAFLDTFGDDQYNIFVWGTFYVTTVAFWISGFVFLFMDYFQMPKFLMKYKVQPGKNQPPENKKVLKVFVIVFINQLMGIPAAMIGYVGMESDLRYVPDCFTAAMQFLFTMILYDAIFYHSHRLLHHRYLYKHIHKVHHEWQAPIGIASSYAHPVENIMTTYIAGSAGALVSKATIPVAWLWYCWLQFNAQCDHSGYHFPMMASPEFHDYHHLKFHTSYGWLSFWDWFYGTDAEFQKTKAKKKRHIRLLTLKSAREIFPEEN